jgi:hypothetical protein
VTALDGSFNIRLDAVSSGGHLFGFYAEDAGSRRSPTITVGLSVVSGAVTTISDIFFAPTIDVDKSEVKQGNPITVFGLAIPGSAVTITLHSDEPATFTTKADAAGLYSYTFLTDSLSAGPHSVQSSSATSGSGKATSASVGFSVSNRDIAKQKAAPNVAASGDINGDGKVNLIDFSVAAFWYKKPNPPKSADINGDGQVNLVDLSIMASNWSG